MEGAMSKNPKFDLHARMAADRRLSASYFRALVAMLIGFHNAKTGQCNPSIRKIAKAAAVAKQTVIDAIGAAERLGYLKPTAKSNGGRNRRNSYSFVFSETVQPLDRFENGNGPTDDAKWSNLDVVNGPVGWTRI
jgi:hypothetical protein